MADTKPLKIASGRTSQFGTGDTVAIANGGTSATDEAGARSNLVVPGLATTNTFTAKQTIQATTGQLRLGYDSTNYVEPAVTSSGYLTLTTSHGETGVAAIIGTDPEYVPTHAQLGSAAYASLEQAQDQISVGWKDMTASMLGSGMPPSAAPSLTDFAPGGWTIRREYAFAVNDYAYIQPFHCNHDIKPGGKAYIHMHWTTNGTSTAAVKWEFSYSRAKGHQQAAFSAPVTVSVTQAASGTAYQHMVAEIADVDALALTEPDELIIITARRVTNGGTDNTDTVFGLTVDLHYEASMHATPQKAPGFYGAT